MMNRDQLLKYAEPQVRARLTEIQNELNDLADDFPHLIKRPDGSIPSVLPEATRPADDGAETITIPPTNGNGHRPDDSNETRIRSFLSTRPTGATTREIAKAIRRSPDQELRKLIKRIASGEKRGPALGGTLWSLRG